MFLNAILRSPSLFSSDMKSILNSHGVTDCDLFQQLVFGGNGMTTRELRPFSNDNDKRSNN